MEPDPWIPPTLSIHRKRDLNGGINFNGIAVKLGWFILNSEVEGGFIGII
jgi:hypothetical protein